MQELKDIISYFLKFQKNNSLTNGRLVNLVYLGDWRNVIFYKTPISPINNWDFLTSTRIYSNQILGESLLHQDIFNIDYGLDLYRPESVVIKLKKNSNVKFNFSKNVLNLVFRIAINKKSFKHSLKLLVLKAGLEPARALLPTGF